MNEWSDGKRLHGSCGNGITCDLTSSDGNSLDCFATLLSGHCTYTYALKYFFLFLCALLIACFGSVCIACVLCKRRPNICPKNSFKVQQVSDLCNPSRFISKHFIAQSNSGAKRPSTEANSHRSDDQLMLIDEA